MIKNCKICNKEFKAKSPNNIVCADQKCKRKNQNLSTKKYFKSEKGRMALRKAFKKQYEKNYVRLISIELIKDVYVKKYSNNKTDIKITLHKECAKHNCNNTFYSIANESIESGKGDRKYCSERCSESVRESTKLKNLKVLNPEKLRQIRDRENERRRGKRRGSFFDFEMTSKNLKNISDLHRDHIRPLNPINEKDKGKHIAENLQWLPSKLNIKKSNMPFEEWQEMCKKNNKEYTAILKNYNLKFNKDYITKTIAKVKTA